MEERAPEPTGPKSTVLYNIDQEIKPEDNYSQGPSSGLVPKIPPLKDISLSKPQDISLPKAQDYKDFHTPNAGRMKDY